MLATCSPVDDLILDLSGLGPDRDAFLAARPAAGDHTALTEVFGRQRAVDQLRGELESP